MRRRKLLIGLAAIASGWTTFATADAWTFLGRRKVRWAADHDVIHVGAQEARFDHILIKVEGNGIYIFDLDVRYSNGAPDHIPMGLHIPQGGQSRVINLRGGDRNIRNVSFTYRRPGDFDGPATVELWGQQ
ncbi:hypothetical protein [Neorhizobium vignae]|uniref:hypothetical protein n=1 Tax=Neorhizobium vignae TaxID=690585 RepID=UPI00055EF7D1|nr:hypothetical protein [Neorhizobium vignae]